MTPALRRVAMRARKNAAAFVALLVAIVIGGANFAYSHQRPPDFDPLRLPMQIVANRVEGIDGPAAHLGEDLVVTGTKCNTSGMDIGVTSVVSWQTLEPAGTQIPVSNNSAIFPGAPACTTRTFANPMPQLVQDRTRELWARGVPVVKWQIVGVVTPLGPRPIKRTWQTQGVQVVP